jgi:Ca2+-binding EF-hand superfamily protein
MAKPWDKVPTGVHKGNWQEELVLERETGIRFYPDPRDKKTSLMTTARCITHSERMEPKEYASTQNTTYKIPTEHKDFISTDGKGPRQRAIEAKLRKQVMDETQSKLEADYKAKMQPRFVTEAMSCYQREDFSTKELANEGRIQTFTTNYSTEEPVTFYSHAVKSRTVNFPTTFMPSGQRLFSKNSSFTADIKSSRGYVRAAETHERPLPPSRAAEYSLLQNLRNRIIELDGQQTSSMPGARVQKIVAQLDAMGSENPIIAFDAFVTGLASSLNITFSDDEIKAIQQEFDAECQGCISCAEFLLLIRPSMSPRRLELIDIAFTVCDDSSNGTVSKANVSSIVNPPSEEFGAWFMTSCFGDGNECTFDDFVEFFSNVSCETAEEGDFEGLVKNMFNL